MTDAVRSSPEAAPALPHGPLEKIFENVWFVRGTWPMPLMTRIVRTMTVIRDAASGDVTVVNSMRLSEDGFRQLDEIGPVKHVVRIAHTHGSDDPFFQTRYGAKVHALEGTLYTRGIKRVVRAQDAYFTPDEYFDVGSELPIADAKVYVMETTGQREASILIQRESGILISGDYFHNNSEPLEHFNAWGKVVMKLAGLAKPYNMGVAWVLQMKPSRESLLSLLDIPFEHVLPMHGVPAIGQAREKYRPAIEKFAKKARSEGS